MALREVRGNRRGDVLEWEKLGNINGRINEKVSVIGDRRNAKILDSTYPKDNYYYHSDPYYEPSGTGYSLLKKDDKKIVNSIKKINPQTNLKYGFYSSMRFGGTKINTKSYGCKR